ncbi:hypothetical protein A3H38_02120 [candidate division WOR-1 bacterium RIFCSPLOWO2_02_FULL_46_20]|uniref:Uncharacterized protein n=2 Tax=Saganbacteria TaxID=1703751 RepID=A0A1F4R8K3_UNCSA|nr:MAG: hypothetical protein A3J44_00145 [candidate division WOR-1 bacterium RIFCSPHIGHO2_02_FULL_45_12]OGC04478.1 MAG: hypothetical protein A3H38_02120 [candidate division WOR-1 bacterium RIFCSPLOWO2_02_FULL_46_20]OGC10154.1 MAG: hypothetical protein A3F86_06165 [candidate division WOR-1 bacterium RIFCSPLOWO2_12_FULL_45_9]
MIKIKPVFAGFEKPGEVASEVNGVYMVNGKGTDLGCILLLQEEILRPSLLEFEIKGEIVKKAPWSRLRIEVFDLDSPDKPATSFENDYLTVELSADEFKHLSLPVLGIVKRPSKIQFMVVGPARSHLEIKNVCLR